MNCCMKGERTFHLYNNQESTEQNKLSPCEPHLKSGLREIKRILSIKDSVNVYR